MINGINVVFSSTTYHNDPLLYLNVTKYSLSSKNHSGCEVSLSDLEFKQRSLSNLCLV